MTSNGQAVLKLRLATAESYLDKDKQRQERVEWHDAIVWGKRAEGLSRVLKKGDRAYVEGRLSTRSYDKDGEKRYRTEVVVSEVILCGGKAPARARNDEAPEPMGRDIGGMSDDDDIPF